jgi:hypothetical protein
LKPQRSSDYFASRTDPKDVVAHIEQGRANWFMSLNRLGLRDRWRRSYNLYYGKHFSGLSGSGASTAILRTGAQGEIAAFALNHYRNLIKHTLALTCSDKPAFDVRAINTNADSLQDAKLANSLLESDWKFKQMGSVMNTSAEKAQVYGKGFVFSYWDTFKGKPYSKKAVVDKDGAPVLDDDGKPKTSLVYEGDLEDQTPNPWDVYSDQGVKDWRLNQWVEVGVSDNRWDLMAKYPELADIIRGLPAVNEIEMMRPFLYDAFEVETDQVRKYFWIHKRTMALPNGRMIIHCGSDCVLYDGPVPPPMDETLPAFRIVPGEIFDSQEGYSDAFDLQGINEAINVLVSTGFTNLQANGIQKLWVHPNSNISSSTLAKGLAIIRSQVKPEPLQLTANPQDLYTALQFLVKQAETISGINSVARGDPEHSLKSGVAIAYVQAMAAKYTSAFQASWAKVNEEVATYRIKNYQQYASNPRYFAMAGKRNAGYMGSFTGDKIKRVQTVVVDMGNPLTKTLGGRIEIADTLMEQGKFQTPQDYIEFLETGQFGVMMQDPYDKIAAVEMENQLLMDGHPVQAMAGEAHVYHMQKHLALISNPSVKMNAGYVKNALAHIQEHVQIYKTQDPIFSMLNGEPPPPPPPQPPMPPGPPGPPGPHGPIGPPPGPAGPSMPPGSPPPPGGHPPHHGNPHPHKNLGAMLQVAPPGSEHIPRLPANLQPGTPVPQ